MTITLTTPEVRESLTTVHLIEFYVNQRLKRASLRYEVGWNNGGFNQTKTVTVTVSVGANPSDPLTFEWSAFLNAVPEVAALKAELEKTAIAAGVFVGTYSSG